MTTSEIEKRLTAVEAELARLKAERTALSTLKPHPIAVLEKIHGTFENDEAFQEAMRLGRKWRKSQNSGPRTRKSKTKRK